MFDTIHFQIKGDKSYFKRLKISKLPVIKKTRRIELQEFLKTIHTNIFCAKNGKTNNVYVLRNIQTNSFYSSSTKIRPHPKKLKIEAPLHVGHWHAYE